MERQIDKSKHLIFEHDTYQANIESLRQDLKDKKKIVLFVGAGINLGSDSSIDISWNGLLKRRNVWKTCYVPHEESV